MENDEAGTDGHRESTSSAAQELSDQNYFLDMSDMNTVKRVPTFRGAILEKNEAVIDPFAVRTLPEAPPIPGMIPPPPKFEAFLPAKRPDPDPPKDP